MEDGETISGKMIFGEKFYKTMEEIRNNKFNLPDAPTSTVLDFEPINYPNDDSFLSRIEGVEKKKLNAENGYELLKKGRIIASYDESIELFSGLEGSANLTAHCMVLLGKIEYKPSTFVTYYFYTRSERYAKGSEAIKYSSKIEEDIKKDYAEDRKKFLLRNAPESSILFIDGPLLGGNLNHITREMNKELVSKNILPVHFVKNSNSNLVSDNLPTLKGKYNSDLDWAHNEIRMGERSPFFMYIDKHDEENGKVFCYLRTSEQTVQRVEFYIQAYQRFKNEIDDVMDLVLYMLYAQGNDKNPQVRTIAISEKYARAILKFVKVSYLNTFLFTPTMNSIRFNR